MKILIAYDGSTYADVAIEDLRWAGLPKSGQAMIVSIVDSHSGHQWMMEMKTALQAAESAGNRLQSLLPGWDVWLETPSGRAASVILDRAATWPADLIVVGTQGRTALARLVLGSVSHKVLHDAACSVRVARAGAGRTEGPVRVLIGNDGSTEGDMAVTEVCGGCWPKNTEARILSAVQTPVPADAEGYSVAVRSVLASDAFLKGDMEERRRCEEIAADSARRLEHAGLDASFIIDDNDPKFALINQARNWNTNAIFVGSRGLGLLNRLVLGSVSNALVSSAPCTVEVVRRLCRQKI
jgi:nucleotide-binding universal stress UspA family protein